MQPPACLLLLLLALAGPALGAIAADKLPAMPNFDAPVPFDQYAGYITVDQSAGRALYYWFVESQRSPSSDPVVLWLNGGPGCSSLDGFFYEHGPFHFDRELDPNDPEAEQLHMNPFSWNNVSNVIYLEAPAGVGFSYSNTSSDYRANDNTTAADNYQFLVNWFAAYPEYAQNDFYIAGESYGGIYVPTLAYLVHEKNQDPSNPKLNLKGVLVGNGVTDEEYDATSFPVFAYNHGLYSDTIHKELEKEGCLTDTVALRSAPSCGLLLAQMYVQIGNVNIYDIYHSCYQGANEGDAYSPLQVASEVVGAEVPCINSVAATNYLNNDTIRAAIHALPISQIGRWAICSDKLLYKKLYQTVLPAYETLTKNYRVLFYTGDVDGSVPYVGSMEWLKKLESGGTPKKDWVSWLVNRQVAGYATVYDAPYPITFTTVKGSGHMVPQFKPAQAFFMFSKFLDNEFP
eukprot:TRINITY_DN11090_c0_g1_i2.p1 TRINITY_DN11090_c0_g1~~TRINITY_DN11090_c0_g1_i2.p1  ORF type:complete len:471 (+),score=135.73 TRINITY_DN11090_c0_g1_i2:39-1415(+)